MCVSLYGMFYVAKSTEANAASARVYCILYSTWLLLMWIIYFLSTRLNFVYTATDDQHTVSAVIWNTKDTMC